MIFTKTGVDNGQNITSDIETDESVAKSDGKRFYIKSYRGKLIDPNLPNYRREKHFHKWMKVSEEVYNLFLKFLRTGKTQFLTSAERKI